MWQGTQAAEHVSPLTTLVRGVMEWVFPSSSWDDLHSQMTVGCQTRKLTIASLAELMVVDVLMTQSVLDRLAAKKPKLFWKWCLSVANQIRIQAFRSHPRGPQRPRPKRASGKHRHHYSMQRLLAEEKK